MDFQIDSYAPPLSLHDFVELRVSLTGYISGEETQIQVAQPAIDTYCDFIQNKPQHIWVSDAIWDVANNTTHLMIRLAFKREGSMATIYPTAMDASATITYKRIGQ